MEVVDVYEYNDMSLKSRNLFNLYSALTSCACHDGG